MELKVLLPNGFKKMGWVLIGLSIFLWSIHLFFDWEPEWLVVNYFTVFNSQFFSDTTWFEFSKQNMLYTILTIFPIVGGLFVGFSKEKIEDEFINKLRLSSLLWAVLINYLLLLLVSLTIFGAAFFNVLTIHMFSVLIIFITRFNFLLWKNRKEMTHE